MRRKRVYCFDLWGTLITTHKKNGKGYEDALVACGVARKRIYPVVRNMLMRVQYHTYEEMVDALFTYFCIRGKENERILAARLWEEENKSAAWLPGVRKKLSALHADSHSLALITNTTSKGWGVAEDRCNIASYFDYIYLSCVHENVKPEPRVWQDVARWFDFPPDRMFTMIGDSEDDDLAPARMRGWHAIHRGRFFKNQK